MLIKSGPIETQAELTILRRKLAPSLIDWLRDRVNRGHSDISTGKEVAKLLNQTRPISRHTIRNWREKRGLHKVSRLVRRADPNNERKPQ
jgi:hypothetical protein